jgi:hypothetical protein
MLIRIPRKVTTILVAVLLLGGTRADNATFALTNASAAPISYDSGALFREDTATAVVSILTSAAYLGAVVAAPVAILQVRRTTSVLTTVECRFRHDAVARFPWRHGLAPSLAINKVSITVVP